MKDSKSIPLIILVVIVITGWGVEAESLRGEGDFEFFASVSSLPVRQEGALALTQIAIPIKEIQYQEKDGEFKASVMVDISLRASDTLAYGREYTVSDRRKKEFFSKDLSDFFFITDSTLVKPGEYVLNIRVEDLNRSKKTLFGLIRGENFSSLLQNVFVQVPTYHSGMISISDPVFIWMKDENSRFVTNPMRIYGLKNDSLSFYFKGVTPPEFEQDSLGIRLVVSKGGGIKMAERNIHSPVRERLVEFFDVFDLNRYPAGEYRLTAEVIDGNTISSGNFNVVWELINWQKPQRDLLVEARILLDDKEFEEFKKVGLGEQEKILNQYWKNVDPTPHTGVNENYQKFISRIGYADQRFKGRTRGALTDRGQIYIRFGPPDDIETQNVPRNRDELAMAIEKLEDQYEIVVHSITNPSMSYSRARPKIIRGTLNPFRGNEGLDSGGYELWIYNFKGDPVVGRDELLTVKSGLRFLFVDLNGIGNYELVGTSEEYSEIE